MTQTSETIDAPAPVRRRIEGSFLLLNAIAAFVGALALAFGAIDLGPEIVDRLPLSSPALGGIALAAVVGVPLALAAHGVLRRERLAPELLVGAGVLLVGWIVVQVAFIRSFSWFQPFYASLGIAMILLGRHRAASSRPTSAPSRSSVPVAGVRCAIVTIGLLATRRLHLRRDRIGMTTELPDGRRFLVFRESTSDVPYEAGETVVLSVWFRLRGIPANARRRQNVFRRVSVVNTLLFAGSDGFVTKRWMVDPESAEWAGLYTWDTAVGADVYGGYITAILRPLSTPGSVGYSIAAEGTNGPVAGAAVTRGSAT